MKMTRTGVAATVAAVLILIGTANATAAYTLHQHDSGVGALTPIGLAKTVVPFLGAVMATLTAIWPKNNGIQRGKVLVDVTNVFLSEKDPAKAQIFIQYVDGSKQEFNYDFTGTSATVAGASKVV